MNAYIGAIVLVQSYKLGECPAIVRGFDPETGALRLTAFTDAGIQNMDAVEWQCDAGLLADAHDAMHEFDQARDEARAKGHPDPEHPGVPHQSWRWPAGQGGDIKQAFAGFGGKVDKIVQGLTGKRDVIDLGAKEAEDVGRQMFANGVTRPEIVNATDITEDQRTAALAGYDAAAKAAG